MPRGVNEKVQAARDRKASAEAESSAKAAKQAEDRFWQEAGEGAKSKAQAKREEQEKQRLEAAAKKAEVRRLAQEEEETLSRPKAAAAGKAPRVKGKMTQHELEMQKEAEAAERAAAARERGLAQRREVSEEAYSRLIEVENANRQDDLVEARGLEEAIGALASLGVAGGEAAADKHPEKRMRAAWQAFEKRELPGLKASKPNLKASQYREMLWKTWQKSPENPINTAASK